MAGFIQCNRATSLGIGKRPFREDLPFFSIDNDDLTAKCIGREQSWPVLLEYDCARPQFRIGLDVSDELAVD